MDTKIKIKLNESKLLEVLKSGSLTFRDYEVLSNEPEDFDYSGSEEWQEAKKQSIKAFKQQKKIEFNLRHKSKTSKK